MTMQAPSLFADGSLGTQTQQGTVHNSSGKTLMDLLYDGFYLVFMLRSGYEPKDAVLFRKSIQMSLDEFDRSAKRLNTPVDDIYAAKYAFCALVDETVLRTQASIRSVWEREPLQLVLFGDQLAGENFYTQLEQLRRSGASSLQSLEVFHFCLLLGFQGKYLLEAPEKLSYLIARLGDEIAFLRGKRSLFAPFWAIPDQVRHIVKGELPLWVVVTAVSFAALLAYIGFAWLMGSHTQTMFGAYHQLIQLPAQVANIVITLP